MKTIIWKELRENLKWSALAMLCLTLAEFFTLAREHASGGGTQYDFTICSSTFLMVTSFGCSVIGAALAAIQILPELRKDQWAALLHRPVSRSIIFFGKVSAGLLLYAFATVPPLLASIAYAAAPGQFPSPLVFRMVVPAASDLVLGIAFYFTALLVSLSRGPWYGRRGVLAFFLLPVFFFHMTTSWVFLVPLGASLVLMEAARGAMMSNGLSPDRKNVGRFSFVLVALVAAGAIVLFVDWGISLLPGAHGVSDSDYRDLLLTKEGQIVVRSYDRNGSRTTLMDIQGTPITDERYVGNYGFNLFRFTTVSWDFGRAPETISDYVAEHPRDSRNYAEMADSNDPDGAENWYQLTGRNYFVGYDKQSRRRIGICDREGFHPAGATLKPFPDHLESTPGDSSHLHLYWSGEQLYGVDFSERLMTSLLNAGNEKHHGFELLRNEPGSADRFIAVALERELRILDLKGAPLFAIPYSHDPRIWSQISVGTIPSGDRFFIGYDAAYSSVKPISKESRPTFVDEFDRNGSLIHTYSVAANRFREIPAGLAEQIATFTLPFAPVALYTIAARQVPSEGGSTDFGEYQPPSLNLSLSFLAILFCISAALAICAFLWARKAGFSRESALRWAAFAFCFGLPGFITFRLAADWPTQVRCPQCSRKRSIRAEKCPACHQTWAAPERNGTEIFDLAAT